MATIFTSEKMKEQKLDTVGYSRKEPRKEQDDKTGKMCSSHGCSKTAKVFCKSCKYICSDCEADHKTVRSMKSHVILTLREAAGFEKTELPLCFKHPNNPSSYFVRTVIFLFVPRVFQWTMLLIHVSNLQLKQTKKNISWDKG